MATMFLRVFAVLCALLVFDVEAAVPGKNAILEQIRKNGACCTALNYFLPNKVHFNQLTDLEYQASQSSFWSAQEQSLRPTCIVIPTSSQDVSVAVTILSVGNQASVPGCSFAFRGAGHTPHAGAANIDGGVTIDMQSMNQVVVSGDQKIVSIGPGNRWGNIYPKLDELDLAMVGGRASGVGSGGLITGGGISFFSGRYGFACDNIAAFEVVLANGTIVTASSTSNPTLFKALKGGSGNFGIVTRFDTKLYPQDEFWGGTIAQPLTNLDAVYDFFVNFTVSENYDPNTALLTSLGWVAGVPTLVQMPYYTDGSASWPPPAFAELDSMPKLATTIRKDELTGFTNEVQSTLSFMSSRSNFLTTLTFINRPGETEDLLSEVFKLADAAAKELISVVGLAFTMTLQPLPYSVYSKSAATGGNVLGLDRFQDDLINLLFTLSWQLPLDNARVEARMKELVADIEALTKEKGLFNEFVYLNYASGWQNPIEKYGSANVEFMRGVSRRYDPNGLFQKANPGGFKLGI